MKIQAALTGLLIITIISTAQVTKQPVYGKGGTPRPYPPGGKVTVDAHLREAVVSLDQLIIMSQLIVDGTVTAVLPSISRNPNPDIPAVETDSRVVITEVLLRLDRAPDGLTLLSETLPGTDTILLAQEGGKAGKWDVDVPADPLVKQGERYILFLHADDRKEPPNTSGLPRYYAVGAWSGKAKVGNGKVQFLPSAVPRLHEHDNADVRAFIATVRQRISNLVPKKQYIRQPGQ